MNNSKDLTITLTVLGDSYPISIKREDEELYRLANKELNETIRSYRSKYDVLGENSKKILAMSALTFAIRRIIADREQDSSSIEKELTRLNQELSDYLSANEIAQ